jgi:hypothetical protein
MKIGQTISGSKKGAVISANDGAAFFHPCQCHVKAHNLFICSLFNLSSHYTAGTGIQQNIQVDNTEN